MTEEDHSHGKERAVRFCPLCGSRLEGRVAFGRTRPVCPNCAYVHFRDPKLAVGVVAERDGMILLTRRNHEPRLGHWSFPSGFVDAGETVEEAAQREAREETGVEVGIDRLLGVYSRRGDSTVFIAFAARVIGGQIQAGEEAMEVGYFPPDALPALAFPHDCAIIDAWQAYRNQPSRSAKSAGKGS